MQAGFEDFGETLDEARTLLSDALVQHGKIADGIVKRVDKRRELEAFSEVVSIQTDDRSPAPTTSPSFYVVARFLAAGALAGLVICGAAGSDHRSSAVGD